MNNNKNVFVAIFLAAAVLFVWQYFVATPSMKAEQARQAALTHQEKTKPSSAPVLPSIATGTSHLSREAALKVGGKRVVIDTPMVDGSLLLKGARLDDLRLKNYHDTVNPKSPEIVLLAPKSTNYPYSATFGWVGAANMPSDNSQWTQVGEATLSPGHPVTLTWDNGHGLVFTRVIAIDDQYMFTVADSVANKSGAPATLYPYGVVERQGIQADEASMYLHVGFVGVANGSEVDAKYSDFKEAGTPAKTFSSTGGWVGITDKYWMAAVVPPQGENFNGGYLGTKTAAGVDAYQANYRLGARNVAPGASASVTHRLFAGAKVVDILRGYENSQKIVHFDNAVDWGWFWFLTRPFFWVLDQFNKLFGNFGLAILGLTVIVKLVMFPLANAGFRSMSRMKKLQPQMEEIKKKHKDDEPQKLQLAMMELYKREKVNPVSGCVPILLTIPVFIALYKVLFVTIEMRHAPFYGWIHDLSAPDPTSLLNLFGLIPYNPHAFIASISHTPFAIVGTIMGFLSVGIWPILMGITQWVQTKLNPPPADPVQAKMFAFMPVIFTFMFATFPAGLVIYYAWNNLLTVIQQYIIMKREGADVHLFGDGKPKPEKKHVKKLKAAND
ncbi:MAG: membrane protein insertase YidC [Alphaproteobacteria bacterium]|nr:membrane protein insertase YidC [Alphaproteobacteria bacterium]